MRRSSSVRSIAWGIASAGLLSACGYRFTAGGGELPGKARTLFVPLFANQTAEPEVDAYFTSALRQELVRAGREGGDASDARAAGIVTQVLNEAAIQTTFPVKDGVAQVSRVSAYRVRAAALVRVFRGTEKLGETAVNGSEEYAPGVDCAVPPIDGGTTPYSSANAGCVLELEANRRVALRRLAMALMRRAYENLTSGF